MIDSIINDYFSKHEKVPNAVEVEKMRSVLNAVRQVHVMYPDPIYSYERACKLRQMLGFGSIATFNYYGHLVGSTDKSAFIDNPVVVTPTARGTNKAVYYSVFNADFIVYDFNLNTPVPFTTYCQSVNLLTMQEYVAMNRFDLIEKLKVSGGMGMFGVPVKEEKIL